MAKSDDNNDNDLEALQIGLVRFQLQAIERGDRHLVIFEGRDTAGKDGAIKRIVEHLSVRNTRVVALPKPDERERSEWYFQRYVPHLPAKGELVILNRSWYNRAGVERVMGFSSPEEQEAFLRDVNVFERMLIGSGLKILKLWLDISRKEQAERLEARKTDPLKALKISALDAVAQEKWDDYSKARDEMLVRTNCLEAPWTIIHTDKKPEARANIMRFLLKELAPKEVSRDIAPPDPKVVFPFELSALTDGRLEH